MKAVVAVMRNLVRALWHVARGATFDSTRLFDARRLVDCACSLQTRCGDRLTRSLDRWCTSLDLAGGVRMPKDVSAEHLPFRAEPTKKQVRVCGANADGIRSRDVVMSLAASP